MGWTAEFVHEQSGRTQRFILQFNQLIPCQTPRTLQTNSFLTAQTAAWVRSVSPIFRNTC